jgi:hypothetical protein
MIREIFGEEEETQFLCGATVFSFPFWVYGVLGCLKGVV